MTGSALALATWALGLTVLVFAGSGPAVLALGRAPWPVVARHALWWGAGLATAAVLAASLIAPLASPSAAAFVWAVLALGALLGLVSAPGRVRRGARLPWWPALVAGGSAALTLAVAALGKVTNYDTGLYHLGAISYARDFGVVPGLANVYFGLGYSNAEFPLAAFLGNGPWGPEGYRLLNALVVLAYVLDVLLRLASRSRGPGTFISGIGLGVVLVPMLGLADYWVVSPTSDSPVFVLTFAALAALADAGTGRRTGPDAALAILTVTLACAMRPTMLPMAVLVVAAVVALGMRRRARWLPIGLSIGLAVVMGIEQVLRDRLMSGWLQYPLSIFAFDVPWRAIDPVDARAATLGTARDPARLWQAAEGWGWIGTWVRALPGQWEFWLLVCLLVANAVVLGVLRGRPRRPRSLALVLMPPAAMTLVWFLLTPPAFRFGWGPVFGTLVVLLGWASWSLASSARALRALIAGSSVLVVVVGSWATWTRSDVDQRTEEGLWTFGGLQVPIRTTPLTEVPTTTVTADSGLTLQVPEGTDQCWAAYPLCTPEPKDSLRPLGATLRDGLAAG